MCCNIPGNIVSLEVVWPWNTSPARSPCSTNHAVYTIHPCALRQPKLGNTCELCLWPRNASHWPIASSPHLPPGARAAMSTQAESSRVFGRRTCNIPSTVGRRGRTCAHLPWMVVCTTYHATDARENIWRYSRIFLGILSLVSRKHMPEYSQLSKGKAGK